MSKFYNDRKKHKRLQAELKAKSEPVLQAALIAEANAAEAAKVRASRCAAEAKAEAEKKAKAIKQKKDTKVFRDGAIRDCHANPNDHSRRFENGRANRLPDSDDIRIVATRFLPTTQFEKENRVDSRVDFFSNLIVSSDPDESLVDARADYLPNLNVSSVEDEMIAKIDSKGKDEEADADDDDSRICHKRDLKNYRARTDWKSGHTYWTADYNPRRKRHAKKAAEERASVVRQSFSHGRSKDVAVTSRVRAPKQSRVNYKTRAAVKALRAWLASRKTVQIAKAA